MASYYGNNAYLNWAGKDLSGYWAGEISPQSSVDEVDITAGAGVTHKMRGDGLKDHQMTIMVTHDVADLAAYRAALIEGTIDTLDWGPEGNAAGKPRFEGNMMLQQASGPSISVTKKLATWELSLMQTEAPIGTISGGHTY